MWSQSFRSYLDGGDCYSSLTYEPASDDGVCHFSDLFNTTWRDTSHLQNEVLEEEFVRVAMEQSMQQQEMVQYSPCEAEANE